MTNELQLLQDLTNAIANKQAAIRTCQDLEIVSHGRAFRDAFGDAVAAQSVQPFPAIPDALETVITNLRAAHVAERQAINTFDAAYAAARAHITIQP
jgi:hypothetical protein